MAEFCSECATIYGMEIEPLYEGEICEGCRKVGNASIGNSRKHIAIQIITFGKFILTLILISLAFILVFFLAS